MSDWVITIKNVIIYFVHFRYDDIDSKNVTIFLSIKHPTYLPTPVLHYISIMVQLSLYPRS